MVSVSGGSSVALSICIPTFNRPDLVERAIESVVGSGAGHEAQVEIIVADNSPELSHDVCQRALSCWSGAAMYVPNPSNIGAIANFNQCIRLATGQFVLFVHDDDVLLANGVRDVLEAIAKPNARPVLLFGVTVVDAMGRPMRRRQVDKEIDLGPDVALRKVLSDIEFVRIPAIVVRRDVYQEVGPFEARYSNATDLHMWVRLFSRYGVRCLPTTTSIYSVHTEAATQAVSYDRHAIETLMDIFDAARRTHVLSERAIDACQREFLHQFILGATYLRIRGDDAERARSTMGLFAIPAVRRLGWSIRWLPIRIVLEIAVRAPSRFVRPLVAWVERHDLVRRARARWGTRN